MSAVGTERISKVVGYFLKKGNFAESSPNLPQRIEILAEANSANQSGLVTDAVQITSAQQAGSLYGYGSPIHQIMRILRPVNGGGAIGGIPTFVRAQAEAAGAAARVMSITVTGTATSTGTHALVINGRSSLDGNFYNVNIVSGDTATNVATKIAAAINAVLGCPVSATSSAGVVTVTAKWKGLTSNDCNVSVDINGTSLGLTYAVAEVTVGSGTPSIGSALTAIGSAWATIVINSYGTVSAVMTALEQFNGIPGDIPTGRYTGIIMKPIIALTGSVADDPTSVTDARKAQVTLAICPAPGSKGLPMEAAANMACLFARVSQDTPHLDVSGKSYPDMPVPTSGDIGSMASYENRDAFVKKGCSTVDIVAGAYQVQDFVTTYHPDGETPPQFRYCRNLMLDFNVRYGYYLLEQQYVVDHAIANDNDVVEASNIVKPKSWKGVVSNYADDLSRRALVADAAFMQESISVNISNTNPDRLETFFRYKRTGYGRISSTTAEAGFNFGK